jgi:hypothetical protein
MHTPQQIWQHVTPKAQLLIALSLATVLAFSAGLAAGIYGRATYLPTLTTDRNAVPAVAQPPQAAPAVQQRPAVAAPQTVPHVPISGMGSVYDGSHYGSLLAAPQTVPHVPISGMGSAYDGQTHRSPHPVAVPASPALIGSGSAYDGQ